MAIRDFEEMDTNAANTVAANTVAEAADQPKVQAAPAQPATQPAFQAPAPAAQGGTSMAVGGFGASPLMQLKDAFRSQGVEIPYNTFKQAAAKDGVIALNDGKNDLGRFAEIQPINWHEIWMISPVNQPTEESKQFLRFSNDGVTTTKGENIEAYLRMLKEEMGYTEAKVDKRIELMGVLVAAENVPAGMESEVIVFSLAPSSVNSWNAFLVKQGIQSKLRGGSKQNVKVEVERLSNKKNQTWTAYKFAEGAV